jgi:hypothetical protein
MARGLVLAVVVLLSPASLAAAQPAGASCDASTTPAEPGWRREPASSDAVTVYSRRSPNDAYPHYKGFVTVHRSPHQVLALLYDPATAPGGCGALFPDCVRATIVSASCVPAEKTLEPQASSYLHLTFSSLAGSVRRQVLLRRSLISEGENNVRLSLEAVQITPCAARFDATALKALRATWRLRSEGASRTCASYDMYSDPDSVWPGWVVEPKIREGFESTLAKLKTLLAPPPNQ